MTQARSIMAGDLSARLFRQLTPKRTEQLDALNLQGVERTDATEMVSMVSAPMIRCRCWSRLRQSIRRRIRFMGQCFSIPWEIFIKFSQTRP